MKLLKNTLLNLGGAVVPLIVSLVTVPIYLRLLGEARYGVLAIVWLLIGYFGLFDMGLGLATTNHIARLHDAPPKERENVFWTALLINAVFGLLGAMALWIVGHYLLGQVFKFPSAIRHEVLAAMPWIALAVPLATIKSVMSGALEGREQFLVVNSVHLTASFLSQLIPLGVAYKYGPQLSTVIPAAVLTSCLAVLPLLIFCRKYIPLQRFPRLQFTWFKSLFRYGGWITVTGIVGPLLTSLDRFLIGVISGAQSVTYYTVPFNLVTKASILPYNLARTLFPRFSMQPGGAATDLAWQMVRILPLLFTPMILCSMLFLKPFLRWWVGPELACCSAPIGEILLLGVFINGMAFIPFALLQGQGKPDVVAKLHVLELVPFLGLLWMALQTMGIKGAAIAWSLRVLIDTLLLFAASRVSWSVFFHSLLPPIVFLTVLEIVLYQWGNYFGLRLGAGVMIILVSIAWMWYQASDEIRTLGKQILYTFQKATGLLASKNRICY